MARQKLKLKELNSKIELDLSIFRNTKLTVFEALVKYLREKKGLNYKQISLLLGKDQRNIWTVYSRVCKKMKKVKHE